MYVYISLLTFFLIHFNVHVFHGLVEMRAMLLRIKDFWYTCHKMSRDWSETDEAIKVRKMYQLDANNFTMIFSHKRPLHVSDIYNCLELKIFGILIIKYHEIEVK